MMEVTTGMASGRQTLVCKGARLQSSDRACRAAILVCQFFLVSRAASRSGSTTLTAWGFSSVMKALAVSSAAVATTFTCGCKGRVSARFCPHRQLRASLFQLYKVRVLQGIVSKRNWLSKTA